MIWLLLTNLDTTRPLVYDLFQSDQLESDFFHKTFWTFWNFYVFPQIFFIFYSHQDFDQFPLKDSLIFMFLFMFFSFIRHKGEVTNIKIQNDGDCYSLKGDPETKFATLSALVLHYMERPKSIKEKRGGYIELLYPVRSTDPTNER